MISFTKSFEELQDMFLVHLQNQKPIKAYPLIFTPLRSSLVKWVIDICLKLHFKNETLHRTIFLFDSFISLCHNQSQIDMDNHHDLKLTVIACLSIATKLNELNYNCVPYFTEHILKGKKNKYSNQDLINKEIEILMAVNYETNCPSVYHFNAIFSQVILDKLQSPKDKAEFIKLNDAIVKKYIISDYCVKMTPVNSGIFILNTTLKHFSQSLNIKLIIEAIGKLNSKPLLRVSHDNDNSINGHSNCINVNKAQFLL